MEVRGRERVLAQDLHQRIVEVARVELDARFLHDLQAAHRDPREIEIRHAPVNAYTVALVPHVALRDDDHVRRDAAQLCVDGEAAIQLADVREPHQLERHLDRVGRIAEPVLVSLAKIGPL